MRNFQNILDIAGVHVDDFIVAGDSSNQIYLDKEEFQFAGCDLKQFKDGTAAVGGDWFLAERHSFCRREHPELGEQAGPRGKRSSFFIHTSEIGESSLLWSGRRPLRLTGLEKEALWDRWHV